MIQMKKVVLMAVAAVSTLGTLSANKSYKDCRSECPVLCPISPLGPSNDCCMNLHIDIGLLYQQPSLNNMYPGIEKETIQDGVDIDDVTYNTDKGNELRPCFDYAIGLTASLGYLMQHDDWFLGARFDWLSSSASHLYNYSDEPSKQVLITYPWPGSDNIDAAFAGFSFLDDDDTTFIRLNYTGKVDFYMLDILLSRGSYHSKCFSFEPFAGVKALWFDSNLKWMIYTSDGEEQGFFQFHQDNWGAGPMFGVMNEYHMAEGVSIFADFDIAAIYGEAKQVMDIFAQEYSSNTLNEQYQSDITSLIDCMIYVPVRNVLGLKFSTFCFEDRHYIALKIGYDVRAIMAYPALDRGFYMSGLYTNLVWNF